MTHTKSIFKNIVMTSAAIFASVAMGACANTAETSTSTDTQGTTDNSTVVPEMSASTRTLILNVSGYEKQTGQIMVALYNDEAAFDDEAAPLRDANVIVETALTSITFNDLPPGEYAFKVFHDENGNGKLDTGAFGIPTENYAFSMDASDPFSAPEFEESKFILPAGETTRNVSLD